MVERRKVLEYLVVMQTIMLVMVVAGVSIIIMLKWVDTKVSSRDNAGISLQLKSLIKSHAYQTELLMKANNKGFRFTAGNAWQMSKYLEDGFVDMTEYPLELKSSCDTWYSNWLEDRNLLSPPCGP